jgi:hypothetical protein
MDKTKKNVANNPNKGFVKRKLLQEAERKITPQR